MEEREESGGHKKCSSRARSSCNRARSGATTHSSHTFMQFQNPYQRYPQGILPLPPILQLQQLVVTPPILQSHGLMTQALQKTSFKKKTNYRAASSDTSMPVFQPPRAGENALQEKPSILVEDIRKDNPAFYRDQVQASVSSAQVLIPAKRPDAGGQEGLTIPLLANYFSVQFKPSKKIFHYDVEISPQPSKEIARLIKRKLVQDNPDVLSGALPAFDGRRNLYSSIEFQNDKLEFFITLPIHSSKVSYLKEVGVLQQQKYKRFRVNIRLVSKLDGWNLVKHLDKDGEWAPLPQDFLHALDVVIRENPMEKCIAVGRCHYSSSMGGAKDIGGGAVGLRGFFQSLRPTQQGLALNVDFSVTAFHESIGLIEYLQKRCDFLRDLGHKKNRALSIEEKIEVEKVLKNVRVLVCHRDTDQRYKVLNLTDETTINLKFRDRDGRYLRLLDYFKDQYNHDLQFKNLPCLQISRSKPCYLPMELCVVCEGQKYLGKLSDDQTSAILKMGCQRPIERKEIIKKVMEGGIGPVSGPYPAEFSLKISREMTQLKGRILLPPKLKLGDNGNVKDLIPSRSDHQWNLLDSHVVEGKNITRWALISFGGSPEQRSWIPKFTNQLSQRCNQLGIFLDKSTVVRPQFEPVQALNSVSLLESKLRRIHEEASSSLQLIICVMERKHKGYADLKRIAETRVGIVSQCCLYSNLAKLTSQFLANLALKINAKVGGSTVALFNTLPCQIPRIFTELSPVIFMGADVTHPHPLDDVSPSIAAVVGSMNWPGANKYISSMRSQTHRKEIIEDLCEMVKEILDNFTKEVGKLPEKIIFFRDGVSETQFYKVLEEELQAIRAACLKFRNYKPGITFCVVQKRHHTRLFPNGSENLSRRFVDENIPPGTVVDSVITHPREFDFYLCSHWGMKGTSRPTHYHVLWDENEFTSDEVQKIVHNLCYTFARCTKPVSLVPPAYYAHLAAYRGRLYLERSDQTASRNAFSRSGPPEATPLPKLNEKIKNLMFYC